MSSGGKALTRAVVVLVLALLAALAAQWLNPTAHPAEKRRPLRLEQTVPAEFGPWRLDTRAIAGVVDPQRAELLKKLYSETLSRTYVHTDGYRIMLSIAYGGDQRDALQIHYPEVCYPAQGFDVKERHKDHLHTPLGDIPIVRLITAMGPQRPEPVTYWVTVGEKTVSSRVSKKLAEMSYSLRGSIPDGLLFRVSSIDPDSTAALLRQDQFVADLLHALPAAERRRLAGL